MIKTGSLTDEEAPLNAAWAIGLFGGIPAALIFLFWWIRRWD
jgi:hypothetical protein